MAKRAYFVSAIILILCHTKSSDAIKELPCACGKSSVDTIRMRIVGGVSVVPHSLPWLAAILIDGQLLCGGTVISDRHILTAGHCTSGVDYRKMVVILGLDDLDDLNNVEFRRVVKSVKHENFTSTTERDDNDIAIFTLDRPVFFDHRIQPICLPKPGQEFTGYMAVVAGWGRIGEKQKASKKLLKTELKIISMEECAVEPRVAQSLTPNMICAYYQGRDGCQGDSGGPLMIIDGNDGRYVQVGVVSWGLRCASPRYPGIYTKLSLYNDWINHQIENGLTCKF